MKKFLTLCATFTLVGALFVGCIDNTEAPGVLDIRKAKAELLRAKAVTEAAEAALRLAQADLTKAYAEMERARAEHEKVLSDLDKQRVEAAKLANDYTRATQQAAIAAKIAEYNRIAQQEMAELYKALEKTAQNERDYLLALIDLQDKLWAKKNGSLNAIYGEIAKYLVEKAGLENEKLIWLARYYFYENVDMPYVERQLAHEVELSELHLSYTKYMFDIWTEIKNLAIDQYHQYAVNLLPKMEELKEKEVVLMAEWYSMQPELDKLAAIRKDALDAYEGGSYRPSISNVFSQRADDIFLFTNIEDDTEKDPKWVASGVYGNTYSFYNLGKAQKDGITATSSGATMEYWRALEILEADKQKIEKDRIFKGTEAEHLNGQVLTARENAMKNAKADYTTYTQRWIDAYAATEKGGTWKAEKDTYDAKLLAWTLTYGKKGVPKIESQEDLLALYATFSAIAKIPDANLKKMTLQAMSVNDLYRAQAYFIDMYVRSIKGAISGDFADSELMQLLGEVNLSDVLGGITINPYEILSLIFGPGNMAKFKGILDILFTSIMIQDLVTVINMIMPYYYEKAEAYLGSSVWGTDFKTKGPIFQKYMRNTSAGAYEYKASNFEYHAWFILYILLESNPIVIGNQLLSINATYTNAGDKLCKDFLGLDPKAEGIQNFPGNFPVFYNPTQAIVKSGTALKLENRVGGYTLYFNPVKTVNAANVAASPALQDILTAENALRKAWHDYGTNVNTLNTADKKLYAPYHRTWETDGYDFAHLNTDDYVGTPPWLTTTEKDEKGKQNPASNVKAPEGKPASDAFYFTPEYATGPYPSIVDGVDLYWTNLSEDYIIKPGPGMNAYQINYWPAIAAYRTYLRGINWNRWLQIGYPNFGSDPILWINDFSNSWENNGGGILTDNDKHGIIPRAFVTERNYNEYKFWVSTETQDAYKALIEKIDGEIAKVEGIREDLYAAYTTANAEWRAYNNKRNAILAEAKECATAYNSLNGVYSNLYNKVAIFYWDNDNSILVLKEGDKTYQYDYWFHAYTDAQKKYDEDVANYETFMSEDSRYIYLDKNYSTDQSNAKYVADGKDWSDGFRTFVGDQRKIINANLDRIDERLRYIKDALASLEYARINILAVYND